MTRCRGTERPLEELAACNHNMYGSAAGVIDLGASLPLEIVAQADLRSNDGYTVGLLFSECSEAMIGATKFKTAAASDGGGFTNEAVSLNAANVQIVSDGADTRTVTVYGTVHGTNTVQAATGTLNGAAAVNVAGPLGNWGFILAAEVSAASATRTVTVQTVGAAAIAAIAGAGVTTAGIIEVTADQRCYGLPVATIFDAAGTQTIGIAGEDSLGNTIYDALTAVDASTTVNGRTGFAKVTRIMVGPVPAATAVTVQIGNLSWQAAPIVLSDMGTHDNGAGRRIAATGRYLHWALCNGTAAAAGGEHDWLKMQAYR